MIYLSDEVIKAIIDLDHHGDQSYRYSAREKLADWAMEASAGLLEVSETGRILLRKYSFAGPVADERGGPSLLRSRVARSVTEYG